jgi:magnesium-transporting ATPase (P-type)
MPPAAEGGLTQREAERRLAARGEVEPPATSRSWSSILRANLLTVFNVTLLLFGIVTLIFGDWRDAVFLGILVLNAGIGIVQEARAKASLDRLAALVAPRATVVRDGRPVHVAIAEVVPGDLVLVGAGDQVVADGRLVRSDALGVDESILTGEAEPVDRGVGEEVRAGSFAVEGSGGYVAAAVGPDTYAERLVGEAREFRHPRSPLERAMDRLILILGISMVPLGALLGWSLIEQDTPVREAVATAVAGVITLVPEGLVLLVGVTYAVATLRMTRRGALSQQLNAVESLASVDVICLDKTGTLTEEALRVVEVVPADGVDEGEFSVLLGRFAASSPSRTSTLDAVAAFAPGEPEPIDENVPFASRRRWSGVRMGNRTFAFGAPEHFPLGDRLAERVRVESAAGRRVLALAAADVPLALRAPDDPPPAGLEPLGLVVLAEELRADTRETIAFLLEEGIQIRVISGDAPATVAAIAADAGIPVLGEPLDGRDLPPGDAEMRALARGTGVVGRISPDGKKRFVEALAADGSHVVMVGDGVNDVPALKAARLAIAQGSGSQMARGIADLILVKGGFASLPPMIREGRKVLRNLQRVAKLFVAKSVLAAFLVLTVGLSSESYPFLPRHLTLASAITIGIPAFFLALAPSAGAWRPDRFLRELASFAIPAGTAIGLGVVASFLMAINLIDMDPVRARTVATTVLVAAGLYLIVVLESSSRVRGWTVGMLCIGLFVLYVVVLSLPGWREFFEVAAPDAGIVLCALIGTALAAGGLALTDERFLPEWPRKTAEPS